MWSALKSVRDNGERQCQHCCPCAADESVRHEQQGLRVDERNDGEAYCADGDANAIGYFQPGLILNERQNGGPGYAGYGLSGENDTQPVAGCLVVGRLRIEGPPYGVGNSAVGIYPHELESSPTEELYDEYTPVVARCILQELYYSDALFFLFLVAAVVHSVLVWRHLLHVYASVYDTDY